MLDDFSLFTIASGVVLFLLVSVALYRIMIGPTAIDRIVAVNIVGTKTAVLLVVIGVVFDRVDMFVDFALAYALLNFMGSVAAARYLHKLEPTHGSSGSSGSSEGNPTPDASPRTP